MESTTVPSSPSLPRDRYGLPLSTSPAAADHYVEAVDRMLSGNAGAPEALARALEEDQGFALGHAALAVSSQLRACFAEAPPHAERALALTGGLTRRERQHVEAIAATVRGEVAQARALMAEHLAEFPRDALILLLLTSLVRSSGQQEWPVETLAMYAGFAPHYGDDWWFLGSHSFVHHELRHYEPARRLGERSLELYPHNATPTHSLAHVFYETGDHPGGIAFLQGWIAGYERQGLLQGHLSWHLALFELAVGRYGRAIEIYERSLDPALTTSNLTLPDAASFLWRWQLYGLAMVAERALPWGPVRDLALQLTARPGAPFADAHAALAYAGARDEVAMGRLVDGLRQLDAQGHPLAGTIVLPLVQGIDAFARADYAEAIRLIEPLMGRLVRIGGSHAQREVFEDTLIQAYLRAGRFERAAALLRERLEHRHSARDLAWLGQAGSWAVDVATP